MEEILKIVGRNIRRKREHDGLTIAEAAERTTLSISEYKPLKRERNARSLVGQRTRLRR